MIEQNSEANIPNFGVVFLEFLEEDKRQIEKGKRKA